MSLLGWALIRETELLALRRELRELKDQEARLVALRSKLVGQQESIRLLVAENYRLRNTPAFSPFTPVVTAGEGRTGIELPSLEAGSWSWGLSGGKAE